MQGVEGCLERENRVGKQTSLAVVRITLPNDRCLMLGDFMSITHSHISYKEDFCGYVCSVEGRESFGKVKCPPEEKAYSQT